METKETDGCFKVYLKKKKGKPEFSSIDLMVMCALNKHVF